MSKLPDHHELRIVYWSTLITLLPGSGPALIAACTLLPAPAPLGVGPALVGVGLAVLRGVGAGAVPGGAGKPVTMTAGA